MLSSVLVLEHHCPAYFDTSPTANNLMNVEEVVLQQMSNAWVYQNHWSDIGVNLQWFINANHAPMFSLFSPPGPVGYGQ